MPSSQRGPMMLDDFYGKSADKDIIILRLGDLIVLKIAEGTHFR